MALHREACADVRCCSAQANLGYKRPRFAKRSRHPNDGSRSSFAFLRFRRFFQQKKQCCEVRKPPILQKVTCWGTGAPDSLLPVNESSRHHNDGSRSWFPFHEINAFFPAETYVLQCTETSDSRKSRVSLQREACVTVSYCSSRADLGYFEAQTRCSRNTLSV